MSDPNENFNAGLYGQGPPASGGKAMDDWLIGNSVRWQNAERLAGSSGANPASAPFTPSMPAPIFTIGGGSGPTIPMVGRKVNPRLGFLLLLFVAVPLYQYSLPLWFALYPGAAVIAAAAAFAVFVESGNGAGSSPGSRLLFAGIVGFLVAWPMTIMDQRLAGRRGYRAVRHAARLVLIFLWVIYALTLHESQGAVFSIRQSQFPALFVWSPQHIGVAAVVVGLMHLWLWHFDFTFRSLWQRLKQNRSQTV